MASPSAASCQQAFGYHTITVERPLRDAEGQVVLGEGQAKKAPARLGLRDTENALTEDVGECFKREVLPMRPMPDRPGQDQGGL